MVLLKAIETGIILSIMTEIKEFATIVLWKLVIKFGYKGRTVLV